MYLYKKSDSLPKLAQENNVSLDRLVAANPGSQFRPGEAIRIPDGGPPVIPPRTPLGAGGSGTVDLRPVVNALQWLVGYDPSKPLPPNTPHPEFDAVVNAVSGGYRQAVGLDPWGGPSSVKSPATASVGAAQPYQYTTVPGQSVRPSSSGFDQNVANPSLASVRAMIDMQKFAPSRVDPSLVPQLKALGYDLYDANGLFVGPQGGSPQLGPSSASQGGATTTGNPADLAPGEKMRSSGGGYTYVGGQKIERGPLAGTAQYGQIAMFSRKHNWAVVTYKDENGNWVRYTGPKWIARWYKHNWQTFTSKESAPKGDNLQVPLDNTVGTTQAINAAASVQTTPKTQPSPAQTVQATGGGTEGDVVGAKAKADKLATSQNSETRTLEGNVRR